MSITVAEFGKTKENEAIFLYKIVNENGTEADISSFGANLVNLLVRDKDDNLRDVVLGFDKPEKYLDDGNNFGATVGPIANRTANAETVIDGNVCKLEVNDGVNNLHSSFYNGYQKRLWTAVADEEKNAVTLTVTSKDGDLGLPGNRTLSVTYTLSDEDELIIDYVATTDKNTLFNPTNHTYFNLNGHDAGNILDEELVIKAKYFTKTQPGAIPTGDIIPVAGTPLDFTSARKIGDRINDDDEQLKAVNGYDHNYCLDDYNGELQLVATLIDANSGIVMDTYTTLPGIQLYTSNYVDNECGKQNSVYNKWQGVCLETQYYPNSANDTNFLRPLFGPDEEYKSTTVYQFSTLC